MFLLVEGVVEAKRPKRVTPLLLPQNLQYQIVMTKTIQQVQSIQLQLLLENSYTQLIDLITWHLFRIWTGSVLETCFKLVIIVQLLVEEKEELWISGDFNSFLSWIMALIQVLQMFLSHFKVKLLNQQLLLGLLLWCPHRLNRNTTEVLICLDLQWICQRITTITIIHGLIFMVLHLLRLVVCYNFHRLHC